MKCEKIHLEKFQIYISDWRILQEKKFSQFEHAIRTKTRWSRRETGSPEEQMRDKEEYGDEELSGEQIVLDNEHRGIHGPIRNTLDLRKFRPTDHKTAPN